MTGAYATDLRTDFRLPPRHEERLKETLPHHSAADMRDSLLEMATLGAWNLQSSGQLLLPGGDRGFKRNP